MRQRDNTLAHVITVAEAMAQQAITAAAVTIMGDRAILTAADTLITEGPILTGLERPMDITRTRLMAVDTILTPTMAEDITRIRTMAGTPPGTAGTRITSLGIATTQRQ